MPIVDENLATNDPDGRPRPAAPDETVRIAIPAAPRFPLEVCVYDDTRTVLSIEVAVSLMDFKNKEWWLVAQGLDKDDGLSYLYRAAMLEVFNGEGALRGIPDDIELKSVRLWGENRDFQKGMFFALAAMLLLLGGFIYMAFRRPRDAKALEAQLKEAARLLKQTDKSIAEIAIAVGFKSSSRLEREFCRLYGKKPLEYRKKDV